MTNEQLIEQAKEAMKQLSASPMLEHEQSAYNCLRLFCKRLEKIQLIHKLVEDNKECATFNIQYMQEPEAADWGHQEGVLMTNAEAIKIYEACFGE